MASQTLIFQRATDNVAPNATISVNTGTEDLTYPAANLADWNPAKPAQLTTTDGSWVFEFSAPQRIDLASIVMHNLDVGLDVRLQGHASSLWTSPSLNLSFTIPTYRLDGFPYNPWLDVKAMIPVEADRTFQFWRLAVLGTNSAVVKIGELWLGATKRNLIRNIKWGSKRREVRPSVIHETDYLVKTTYDLGTVRRSLEVTIENTDVSLADVMAWGQSCRWSTSPTLIVPNPDENDAWMVHFTSVAEFERVLRNYNVINLSFEELSRGLTL